MTFHQDAKEISIALLSTSALLLTILAVVHSQVQVAVQLGAVGLYASIVSGAVVLLFVLVSAREVKALESSETHKFILVFFLVQLTSFLTGLVGIFWTVVFPH